MFEFGSGAVSVRSTVAILVSWLALTAPAIADVCKDVDALRGTATADEGLVSKFLQIIWQQDTIAAEAAPQELLFTSSSGFALYPTCAGKTRFKTFLYYPIGLVVRDTGVREKLRGHTLRLVESEYALLLLIPDDHLTKLEPGKTYVFANGLDFPPYCRERECFGETAAKAKKRQFVLNPTRRFSMSDTPINGCEPLQVALYDKGNKLLRRADGKPESKEYVLPCFEPTRQEIDAGSFGTRRNGQVKIVTADAFKVLFDVPLRGDYHRLSKGILERFAPSMTSVKPCGTTLTFRTANKASAGMEVGGSYFIFSGKFGGNVTEGATRTRQLGADVFMQSSTYSLVRESQADNSDQPVLGTAGSQPIVTYLKCDRGLTPKTLSMVRVYNESLGDVPPVILLPEELQNTAAGQANGEMGEFAGIMPASPSARERGQVWRVKGYYEYFRLRDAFRSYISNDSDLPEILHMDGADQTTLLRYIDYFAHLLMAATTEPRPF